MSVGDVSEFVVEIDFSSLVVVEGSAEASVGVFLDHVVQLGLGCGEFMSDVIDREREREGGG